VSGSPASDGALDELVTELARLPGIGPKSAQRIAFHLLRVPIEEARRLAAAILAMRERTTLCARCFGVADGELCRICLDEGRDHRVVCVVEDPRDVMAIERTREHRGRYHVLHGAINPVDGVGPEQLKVQELVARIGNEGIEEVVVCTNPTLEGEATAMYLAKLLKPMGVRVTRIASGLPVGADLEYADELTIGRALQGRRELPD
jgi:recombination protein RecR